MNLHQHLHKRITEKMLLAEMFPLNIFIFSKHVLSLRCHIDKEVKTF